MRIHSITRRRNAAARIAYFHICRTHLTRIGRRTRRYCDNVRLLDRPQRPINSPFHKSQVLPALMERRGWCSSASFIAEAISVCATSDCTQCGGGGGAEGGRRVSRADGRFTRSGTRLNTDTDNGYSRRIICGLAKYIMHAIPDLRSCMEQFDNSTFID